MGSPFQRSWHHQACKSGHLRAAPCGGLFGPAGDTGNGQLASQWLELG